MIDGLQSDGVGGIVAVGHAALAQSLGFSEEHVDRMAAAIAVVFDDEDSVERQYRYQAAQILVQHFDHEERMCILHTFYGADVAPCSGEKLCRLQKRVARKMRRETPDLERLLVLSR